ncbi:MAG: hypothetical protein VW297_10410, partial [Paracoccaceae bacterium]
MPVLFIIPALQMGPDFWVILSVSKPAIARMNDAITAYQNALQVRTKDSAPMDWAMTQENMALVYWARAT